MSNDGLLKKLDGIVDELDKVDKIIKEQEKDIKDLKKILKSLYEELHIKKQTIDKYQEKCGILPKKD